MFYRFRHILTITEPSNEEEAKEKEEQEEQELVRPTFRDIARVRSTNRLTSDDTFEGTGTVDFLNENGVVQPGPPITDTHTAVRLQLVP